MSDSKDWLDGSCLCGSVRYAIDRSGVVGQAHCHCRDCQRATGSAFASFCFVPDVCFRADRGQAKGYTVQGMSGGGVTRYFCPDCGSQLFSEVATMPGVKFVKSGSLEDASWMRPQAMFWCDTAQPWVEMPAGLTAHAKNPG